MRKFLIATVVMLGIIFLMFRLGEVEAIIDSLQKGKQAYILLAVFCIGMWLLNTTVSYQAIYQALGVAETVRGLLPVVAASNFVKIIAPSAGASAMAVFISEARQRGYSTAKAMVACALFLEFDYLGFLGFLGLGLIVLLRRGNLTAAEISATALLVLLAGLLSTLIYLGTLGGNRLESALVKLTRLINRILRPISKSEYISEERAREFGCDAVAGLAALRAEPESMLMPAVLALTTKAWLVLIFLLSFMAFNVPISPGTIVAGFSISYLFFIVSPTPAGVGIVEGVMVLVLASMYIDPGVAVLITLAYRGVTFWIPLLAGMIAFRWLNKRTAANPS